MTGTEIVAYAWKEWGLQALVLLSFTLQVTLLIFAEFRRSVDSSVLRAVLWSAYLLADSTAIYVLGHMSVVTSSRSPERELMAFWATFLLLHLGGQDNITAYAIEDNRLWLRHLQTFVVQVAAAAYVLYQSGILGGRSTLLQQAAILMLVVGVVKYGERVWTLKCADADNSPSGKNYRSFEPAGVAFSYNFDKTISLVTPATGLRDAESLLLTAHLTLDVAKEVFKGRLPYGVDYRHVSDLQEEEVCKVVEMQLSLMHDVLYTKLEVTRSWYCLCIRVFTMLCTAVALLLFHLHKHSVSRYSSRSRVEVDVGVTYALLVGAVILEMMWMFRAMFSSWTCALLAMRCNTSLVASLRRLVRAAEWRRKHWSGSIGQQDLLELYARSKASKMSRIARCIGVEDMWNTLAYTGSIPVSACIKQLLVKQVVKSKGLLVESPDHILNSRGRAALNSFQLHDTLAWSVDDTNQLEGMIITWHIATCVYHHWYKDQEPETESDLAKAVVALSNYMLFLLAARPDMLPPIASRNAFVETCFGLTCLVCTSAEDLATKFHRYGDALNAGGGGPADRFKWDTVVPVPAGKSRSLEKNQALKRGCRLGAILVGKEKEVGLGQGDSPAKDMLELIAEVWLEILCYAGHRCSAYSHAKALSSGGELITVSALLVKYFITLGYLSQDPAEPSGFSLE